MDKTIKRIVDWNDGRGLLDKPFNHDMEAGFIIEEILESYGYTNGRGLSKEIIALLRDNELVGLGDQQSIKKMSVDPKDVLDAFVDIQIYCVGAIAKLAKSVPEVINAVMDKNDAKGSETDSQGKIIKKEDFINPDLEEYLK